MNSILYVGGPVAMVGITLYVALTQQIPRTVNPALALGFCALFGTLMVAMATYGILTLALSRLCFDDLGLTYRDVTFPTLYIPWKEVTAISIENISDRSSA